MCRGITILGIDSWLTKSLILSTFYSLQLTNLDNSAMVIDLVISNLP